MHKKALEYLHTAILEIAKVEQKGFAFTMSQIQNWDSTYSAHIRCIKTAWRYIFQKSAKVLRLHKPKCLCNR